MSFNNYDFFHATFATTSTTIANIRGDSTDPWCAPTVQHSPQIPPTILPPLTFVFNPHISSSLLAPTLSAILSFLVPFRHFSRNPIKCFFLVYKTHAPLFLFSTEFLSHPSQNKQRTSCAFPRHTAKSHIIYRNQSSYSVLQLSLSLHSFHCVLHQLYFSMCSTIHHTFPLMIGTTTLVFHSSDTYSPSSIFWQSFFIITTNFPLDIIMSIFTFQNRFKKRRKHLLNLGSLEKDCFWTKHFRLALFRVQCES